MLIDCDTCAVRGDACAGCIVTVLLGATHTGHHPLPGDTVAVAAATDVGCSAGSGPGGHRPRGLDWDDTERAALRVLADSGLVPPLRLVPSRMTPRRATG